MKRILPIWIWLFLGTVLIALALRVPRLGDRPMHTDEAVQAVKFGALLEEGAYQYDPHEYHGPTLYYLTLPVAWLCRATRFEDVTEEMLRSIPLLFGIGMLLLLPLVRDAIGRGGVVLAGLLTALSPILVYYSRYYVQESMLVFFGFGLVACGWRYLQRPHLGWALALGVCAGMMQATKETCVLHFAALGGAAVVAWWLGCRRRGAWSLPFRWGHLAAAVAVTAGVSVLFYSSFFTHPAGIWDSLRSYFLFTDRAEGQGHEKPWWYYAWLLGGHRAGGFTWSEGLLLMSAAVGLLFSMPWKGRRTELPWLGLFLSVYLLLLLGFYSLIPYKTPWLMMGFMQGACVLAGFGLWELLRRPTLAVLGMALLLVGVIDLGGQAHRVAYRFPADERNPYAYSHTASDCLRMAERIHDLAALHEQGSAMAIQVISAEYWPLPWYLRDLERVGYWTEVPDKVTAPVVMTSPDYADQVEATLGEDHVPDFFGLRPAVLMQVYTERPLWEAYLDTRR